MQTIAGMRFYMDTPEPVEVTPAEQCLKGWLISASPVNLTVLVDGVRYPAVMGMARPDVAAELNEPEQENCGFVVRFPDPILEGFVTLVAEAGADDVKLATVPVAPRKHSPERLAGEQRCVSGYRDGLAQVGPTLYWPQSQLRERMSALPHQPLLSVLLPTCNGDPYYLRCCINSVRQQEYPNWELCILDTSSPDHGIDFVKSVAAEDNRVRFAQHSVLRDLARIWNSAVESAKGEFVVFLNQDDELHPYALLELVRHLNLHTDAHVFYSDEDSTDALGCRSRPVFKRYFDAETFLSLDYLGDLLAIRRRIVAEVGGFDPRFNGACRWDFLIRTVEKFGPAAVQHIAKPLYHRRCSDDAQLSGQHVQPELFPARTSVLQNHISRTKADAVAEADLFYGSIRMRRYQSRSSKVAVVLRAEDGDLQFPALAGSVDCRNTRLYRLVGPVMDRLPEESRLPAPERQPNSYCSAFRAGSTVRSMTELREDLFVFINRPVQTVNHCFFEELAVHAMRNDVGVVTGISIDGDSRIVHTGFILGPGGELLDPFAGIRFPTIADNPQLGTVRLVAAISDEFFAVARRHLAAVGGLGIISADCMPRLVNALRLNARAQGLKVLVTPYAVATLDEVGQQRSADWLFIDAW